MIPRNYLLPADWDNDFEARQLPGCTHSYKEFVGKLEISPNDNNQYRLLRLSNNMVVVCVQDTDAKQASAGVTVNIGASSDPPELLGLAHFLEHMLLRGSKKYPEENDYKKFVYGNAGSCNAVTYPFCTKYFFAVDNSALEGGLDRLSRFFIDPLMDPDCIDRELNAIESEFRSKLQDDGRRAFVILKSAADQSHSFAKFGTGNNQTLRGSAQDRGLNIRDEMLAFYKRFYSSDLMKLVIVGNYSLDQMTQWAVSMFSEVESKGDTKIVETSHPFGHQQLGKVLCYEPVGEKDSITLVFALPEIKPFYKSNPYKYVSSLFCRADRGSLLSYLQKKGLATSVSADVYDWLYDGFNVFIVKVWATPAGIIQRGRITEAVFAYIKMLTCTGPQQQYYSEIKAISDSNYRVFKKRKARDLRSYIENGIHNDYIQPEHIVYKSSPIGDFEPHLIVQLLQYLVPTNYMLLIQSRNHKDVVCDREERFYGIKYRIDDLPLGLTSEMTIADSLVAHFHMPAPNAYLPENLHVEKSKDTSETAVADVPALLTMNGLMEVWFKRDDQFFVPQGSIKLSFDIPEILHSARELALAVLYTWYISDFLRNELDSATCAGLSFNVKQEEERLLVSVSGFNDKLSALLLDILARMKTHSADSCLFGMCKKKLVDGYANMVYNKPVMQAIYYTNYLNRTPNWDYSTVAKELDSLTIDDMQGFIDRMFNFTYVKMIMAGNFYEGDALDTAKRIKEILNPEPLRVFQRGGPLFHNFDKGHFVLTPSVPDKDCKDNAIICQIQCNSGLDRTQTCIRVLLAKILYEPFFDQLRTKEQLGYLVSTREMSFRQAKGKISFEIQSSFNPAYLTLRINHFLHNFRQTLVEYEDARLVRTIESIVETWRENHKSISDEAGAHWSHIVGGDYTFNYNRDNVDIMAKLTKKDLIEFWDEHINPTTSPGYSRIDYQLWSCAAYKPTVEEMSEFSLEAIAAHGFLHQEGLADISVSQVAGVIDAADKSATSNELINAIRGLCRETLGVDKIFEEISDVKSKARAALEMALDRKKNAAMYPLAKVAEFEEVGMRRMPANSWLIEDIEAFKATQPLSKPTVPTRILVPKYEM
ncbi:metalloprotease [Coemansia sp. RSA 2599]|nr:metalloprotease [Coemansia sp. RSA 2598]KAJ1829107.1 metalloprotease [Coemansia sp. RSA 2599]